MLLCMAGLYFKPSSADLDKFKRSYLQRQTIIADYSALHLASAEQTFTKSQWSYKVDVTVFFTGGLSRVGPSCVCQGV